MNFFLFHFSPLTFLHTKDLKFFFSFTRSHTKNFFSFLSAHKKSRGTFFWGEKWSVGAKKSEKFSLFDESHFQMGKFPQISSNFHQIPLNFTVHRPYPHFFTIFCHFCALFARNFEFFHKIFRGTQKKNFSLWKKSFAKAIAMRSEKKVSENESDGVRSSSCAWFSREIARACQKTWNEKAKNTKKNINSRELIASWAKRGEENWEKWKEKWETRMGI
jgi:hypothetical protein